MLSSRQTSCLQDGRLVYAGGRYGTARRTEHNRVAVTARRRRAYKEEAAPPRRQRGGRRITAVTARRRRAYKEEAPMIGGDQPLHVFIILFRIAHNQTNMN